MSARESEQPKGLSMVRYLRVEALGDRDAVLLPFWDGERWCLWIPGVSGEMIEMHPVEVESSAYVAKTARRPTDIYFPFLNTVWQRLSWSDVLSDASAIVGDFRNLAVSFGKLEFLWLHRSELSRSLGDFVATEVEYVLTVTRGLYDHLQQIICALWRRTRLHHTGSTPRNKLPETMHALLFDKRKDRPRTAVELQSEFGLPDALVTFYLERTQHTLALGQLRNAIVHRGEDVGTVFVTERGYCIPREGELSRLAEGVWKTEHQANENLLSLKPLLSHVVLRALETCSQAMATYASIVECPPAVMPDCSIFNRMGQGGALLRAQNVLIGGSPWWDGQENAFEPEEPGRLIL